MNLKFRLLDRVREAIRTRHHSRRMECLPLRVQDVDFEANQITVRDGKGFKDRVSMLPAIVNIVCSGVEHNEPTSAEGF